MAGRQEAGGSSRRKQRREAEAAARGEAAAVMRGRRARGWQIRHATMPARRALRMILLATYAAAAAIRYAAAMLRHDIAIRLLRMKILPRFRRH